MLSYHAAAAAIMRLLLRYYVSLRHRVIVKNTASLVRASRAQSLVAPADRGRLCRVGPQCMPTQG